LRQKAVKGLNIFTVHLISGCYTISTENGLQKVITVVL